MTKTDLARGEHLFLGLNSFAPGEGQAVHAHAGADKFYLVVSGKARITSGATTTEAGPGQLVWCPAGAPHGVEPVQEPTVLMIGMSPPPRK